MRKPLDSPRLAKALMALAALLAAGAGPALAQSPYAGSWRGTLRLAVNVTCNAGPVQSCTYFYPWTGTVDSNGLQRGVYGPIEQICNGQPVASGFTTQGSYFIPANGSVSHLEEDFSFRVANPQEQGGGGAMAKALDSAMVANVRIGMGKTGFYAAVDLELGGVIGADEQVEMMTKGMRGTPEIDRTSVTMLGAYAVVGFRGRHGRTDMGAEVAAGGYAVSYAYHSQYHACENTASVTAAKGSVEARARAAYWVSPYAQVGVAMGKSLTDTGWMSGVFINGMTRSFGGR